MPRNSHNHTTVTRISQDSTRMQDGFVVRDRRPLQVWSDDQQVWGPGSDVAPGASSEVDGAVFLALLRECRHGGTAEIINLSRWLDEQPDEARVALRHFALLELTTLVVLDMVADDWERAVRILLDLDKSHVSREDVKRKWDRHTASYAGLLVERFFGFQGRDSQDEMVKQLRRALSKSLLMYLLRNPEWERMSKRRVISTLRRVYGVAVMREVQSLAEAILPANDAEEEYRKRLLDFDPHEELVAYAATRGAKHRLGEITADLGIAPRDVYRRNRVVKRRLSHQLHFP